jgi:hypothetical protein
MPDIGMHGSRANVDQDFVLREGRPRDIRQSQDF